MLSTDVNMRNITPKQIIDFFQKVENKLHLSWSLRDVRRFLNRIYEFKDRFIKNDPLISHVMPITATHVALSFLLAGPAAESDRMERFESLKN
jgi:hypothetical protein